jgi:hypothetical protein
MKPAIAESIGEYDCRGPREERPHRVDGGWTGWMKIRAQGAVMGEALVRRR